MIHLNEVHHLVAFHEALNLPHYLKVQLTLYILLNYLFNFIVACVMTIDVFSVVKHMECEDGACIKCK